MSQFVELLGCIEALIGEDLVSKLQAEGMILSQQYNNSYIKTLSQLIRDDSPSYTPNLKRGFAIAFRKVLSSRWIESLNFKGEMSEDLKDLVRTEFYEILLSEQSEEIKSEVKKIISDVYTEKWVDVWFLEELIQNAERSNKIFFELLILATTLCGNSHHNPNLYQEAYKKLAVSFASFMKKYLSSLPDYLLELQLLLKCYPFFVFENITRYMGDNVSFFMEHLQQFVLHYPPNDVVLTQEQTRNLLAAKKEALTFWSQLKHDDTNFIRNNSHALYNVALTCIKTIPGSHEYDGVFDASKDLVQTLLAFFYEDMNLNKENFDQIWNCSLQSALMSSDMEEANLCMQEPWKYVRHVLDRDAFAIHYHRSSSERRNHLYNFASCAVSLRDGMSEAFLDSISKYLETHELKNSDNILDKDFYWNITSCLNYDGDDDSYSNKSDTSALPFKMSDALKEAKQLLSSVDDVHPLLQCDALKFIIFKRKQFSVEELNGCLDVLIDLLISQHLAVGSFAACALQRIIYCKNDDRHPIIDDEILLQKFPKLLENVEKNLAIEHNKGNFFVIDVLREAVSNLLTKLVPAPENLLIFLKNQILITAGARRVDRKFCTNLFECIGHMALISVHKSKDDGGQMADEFERIFLPAFMEALDKKHKDFAPLIAYVAINTLLSCYKSSTSKELRSIISKLLKSDLWFDEDLTTNLMHCLKDLVWKYPSLINSSELESILEICYKLLTSQPRAFHSIQVFVSILESFQSSHYDFHLPSMLKNLIKTSETNKDISFLKGLIVFICYAVVKHGAGKMLKLINELNPSFFDVFVIDTAFRVSRYVSIGDDLGMVGLGLSLMLENLAPKAIEDERTMTLWVYLILTLADVRIGFVFGGLIGSRNQEAIFRNYEYPLLYDSHSDLLLDGDLRYSLVVVEGNRANILKHIKETLEKYPQLCSTDKFSSLNFDLDVRNKLKGYIKKNHLPEIPHLNYPGDPGEEEEELCENDEYEKWQSDESYDMQPANGIVAE